MSNIVTLHSCSIQKVQHPWSVSHRTETEFFYLPQISQNSQRENIAKRGKSERVQREIRCSLFYPLFLLVLFAKSFVYLCVNLCGFLYLHAEPRRAQIRKG